MTTPARATYDLCEEIQMGIAIPKRSVKWVKITGPESLESVKEVMKS